MNPTLAMIFVIVIVALVIWVIVRSRGAKPMSRGSKRRPATAAAGEAVQVKLKYLIPDDNDIPLQPRSCAVAGINHLNLGGVHRQDVITDCRTGEPVFLVRLKEQTPDPNAIAVFRADGRDIGFLPREIAAELAPRLDQGSPILAKIEAIEPFTADSGSELLGVRLELTPHRITRSKSQE